jgi:hypothetical protein
MRAIDAAIHECDAAVAAMPKNASIHSLQGQSVN